MTTQSGRAVFSAAMGAILHANGGAWTGARRAALKEQLRAGALHELEFEATVFHAGPNRNFVRFPPHNLEMFAASFADAPFLRNHRIDDIGARDGTVLAGWMAGEAMRQRILLTTRRGMRDFLEGVIDRFSIGWYYRAIECSICGGDWMACEHMPGCAYAAGNGAGAPHPGSPQVGEGEGRRNRTERICELIFLEPQGKETSAVNTPAVSGTGVVGLLSELISEKEARMSKETEGQGQGQWQQGVYLPDGSLSRPEGARNGGGQPRGVAPAEAQEAAGMMTDVRALREEMRKERVEQLISASKLSEAGKDAVRLACKDKDPGAVPVHIEAQLKVEAEVLQKEIVRGIRPVTEGHMTTARDTFQAALNWMFGSASDPLPAPSLRRISDLYQMITGDFNWYGTFNPEFSQLAAASTTTLAGMVVDALNRVVQQHFDNMMVYRWFEPIVSVVPHSGSTHDVNLIMVDGMANLPTVGEGAAYTEAVVGDSRETMAFNKRGHYVGITLETIRKSDIARIQAIPREMVKSAVRTRSAAIADIFTANAGLGPTLAQDNTALFHDNHGNVDDTAFDDAGWAEIRQDIWKQVVPGTGRSLGLWPTFALVPIDLFDEALILFGYGAGDVGKPNAAGEAQTVNPYGQSRPGDPRPIPIAVPDWTNQGNWAAIVDPRLHPVIHMAYANSPQGGSHPLPEIFEATSETQGLMFTNDTLPVKVRDWWAYGVSTYVGVAKRNV